MSRAVTIARRTRGVLPVLVALAAPPLAAAAPEGAPSRLRAARAADMRERAGALSEWWALRAVDPRSGRWLELGARRDANGAGVRFLSFDPGGIAVDDGFGAPKLRATASGMTAGGPDGRLGFDGRRVRLTGAAVSGEIRLRAARRGPAALGWRLGHEFRYPSGRRSPVTLSWSMPVATSRLRGTLALRGGRSLRVDGWRASLEHGWGDLLLGDRSWDFWDEAVVHGRGGSAWVVQGLNRMDTVTGPGARDAQWLGLLARVDRRGLRICRPRVDRRRWEATYPGIARWATRLRLRCHGMRITVRERPGTVHEYVDHVEVRGRTTASRGRTGFVAHLVHDIR